MEFADRWDECMHTMKMPTPSEALDGAEEAAEKLLEKLHEIDTTLGGLGLAEAAEQIEAMGISLEVGGDAAALTVSWWVGNAVGCTVTAAIGDRIVDAIDYLAETWEWIEAKTSEVSYTIPSLDDIKATVEEIETRSSSTAQDDPPPHPIIDQGSGEAKWVRYLQRLLVENHGYQIAIDGAFGPRTAAAVRDFKEHNNLGDSTEVDHYTWRALETAG
jgi:hypothetical protein